MRAGLVSKPGGGGDDARQPTEPGVREDTAKKMPTGQDQGTIVPVSAQATRAADARIVAELLVPEGPPRTYAPSGVRDQLAEPPETPAPARPLVTSDAELVIQDAEFPRRRSPTPELPEMEMESPGHLVSRASLREYPRRGETVPAPPSVGSNADGVSAEPRDGAERAAKRLRVAEAADGRRKLEEERGIGSMERVKKMRRHSVQEDSQSMRRAAVAPEWKCYTPDMIDLTRCMARTWNDGKGGQCLKKLKPGMRFCPFHAKQEGDQGWHGAVDGEIPPGKLAEFKRKNASSGERPARESGRAGHGETDARVTTRGGAGESADSGTIGASVLAASEAGEDVAAPSGSSVHQAAAPGDDARPESGVQLVEALERGGALLSEPAVDVMNVLRYPAGVPLPIDRRAAPLRNIGNTCYLNAILHALAAIPRVASWACGHQAARARERHNVERCQLCAFARDVRHIRTDESGVAYVPEIVRTRRQWGEGQLNPGRQEDANEAFQLLATALDTVDADKLDARAPVSRDYGGVNSTRYGTPFWRIFGFVQRSKLVCGRCGWQSSMLTPESCMQLAFPDPASEEQRAESLDDLLRRYFAEETLGQHRCEGPGCGQEGCMRKQLRLVRWPAVLWVQLKRFRWPQDKIKDWISFPERLPRDADRPSYRLRSVCNHFGDAGGGHYRSYVRGHGGTWYHCDDGERPRQCPLEEVLSSEGYILFYEREGA